MTTQVAEPWISLVAPERLQRFLCDALGRTDALIVEGRARSGNSNLTVFIRFGEERLVLRRPPAGDLLPTAHDVMREVRFLQLVEGTAVPAPRVRAYSEDLAVLGAPFYVMEHKDGILLQDGEPEHLRDPSVLASLCHSAIDTLAVIHATPWEGRDIPGRPTGYLERQVSRWSRQLALTPSAERLKGLGEISAWVQSHVPAQGETTVVHGDYGLHNLLIGARAPEVVAVLDWEMATLGDPIADVVWFLKNWGVSDGGIVNPANYVTLWPGAPSREEMLARYARLTGRTLENEPFHRIFAYWKGIIVTEGLYNAYLQGATTSDLAPQFETQIPAQVEKARIALREL